MSCFWGVNIFAFLFFNTEALERAHTLAHGCKHSDEHMHRHTHTHPSIQGHSLSSTCAPPSTLPLSVSAGSGTPVQACAGTQRWIVSQSIWAFLSSRSALLCHARWPGMKPDPSGPAPLVQVMLHSARLTSDRHCTKLKTETVTVTITHTHAQAHTHSFFHYMHNSQLSNPDHSHVT